MRVELQEVPTTLTMESLFCLRAMTLPFTKIAVRLSSGELFVTRDAPGTKQWREYNNNTLGRANMLCTLGQLSAKTRQALQVSPVRQVMDNLLFRSTQLA